MLIEIQHYHEDKEYYIRKSEMSEKNAAELTNDKSLRKESKVVQTKKQLWHCQ